MKEEWSATITISWPDSRPSIVRHIEFLAKDDSEAKAEILKILKRSLGRIRNMRNRCIWVMALPRMIHDGKKVLNGDRMIRSKFRYGNRKLMRIKNPEVVLVQGYGPEALAKLDI